MKNGADSMDQSVYKDQKTIHIMDQWISFGVTLIIMNAITNLEEVNIPKFF